MKKNIAELFLKETKDQILADKFNQITDPKLKYIIAMTPRSGSSYLCDLIKQSHLLGTPDEYLNHQFIPEILKNVPANNADDYLKNMLKKSQSKNGVSGLKVSWFQFINFCNAMKKPAIFRQFKYIYLIRRDLYLQSVSLYKATESGVFHTNVKHKNEEKLKLNELDYNYKKLEKWYKHIAVQESRWRRFFLLTNIFPLYITYEEIDENINEVIDRIFNYLNIKNEARSTNSVESIFKKIGDRQSIEWASKFALERDEMMRSTKTL
ncbi:Stf0 family sulfotransferase [Nitrosomonas sp. Nm33]|uniref:Stf0 family sulfotransferase n=1 Tax=Nitrosomonas sp. Nm33 TaxID=133724 RepID=UPI0015A470EE|nr:Stf0 family sulfotransferase [Nitrosomonas sp. Nm33]